MSLYSINNCCAVTLVTQVNRPNFLVVKNGGIGSERFSKKLLWKIFNIYMVVICHNRFFQKRVTKKKIFFVTRFLLIKRGFQKSMTEMPEDASNGLKMKFGHQEFDPRKKNDVLWTFRGCFRG